MLLSSALSLFAMNAVVFVKPERWMGSEGVGSVSVIGVVAVVVAMVVVVASVVEEGVGLGSFGRALLRSARFGVSGTPSGLCIWFK